MSLAFFEHPFISLIVSERRCPEPLQGESCCGKSIKAHRVHPQPCCHSWPLISFSMMGQRQLWHCLVFISQHLLMAVTPLSCWHSPSQAGSPDATQTLFLAALCEKPPGHFCCPGKFVAAPGHSGWVSTGTPGDVPSCPTLCWANAG